MGILLQATVLMGYLSYFRQFNVKSLNCLPLQFCSRYLSFSLDSHTHFKHSFFPARQVHHLCQHPLLGLHDGRVAGPQSIPSQGKYKRTCSGMSLLNVVEIHHCSMSVVYHFLNPSLDILLYTLINLRCVCPL